MRLLRLRSWLLASCAAGVFLTVGCGQGHTLYSPTGPSGALGSNALVAADSSDLVATASTADDGVLFTEAGKGGHKDKEKGEDHGHGHQDKVVGFVSAKTTDTLTVRGMTVKVAGTTRIHHGHEVLAFADIQVGDHVQAYGSLSGTTLVATEVKVEDTDHDDDGDKDEDKDKDKDDGAKVEGAVSGFSAAGCPAVTFTVGTTKVTASSATTFKGVTCATLANGKTVEVKGTKQADGSIVAAKVELD
jgi:hypothetical protein